MTAGEGWAGLVSDRAREVGRLRERGGGGGGAVDGEKKWG